MGAMFFAVLAVVGQIKRYSIREKPLEGQVVAAFEGNHGGRPKAIDGDMLTSAVALKDKGVLVPDTTPAKTQPHRHGHASSRVRAHGSNRAPVRVSAPGEEPAP
ncbi:hypothetical protein AB0L71_31010 [Streptomyces sp. NPDC052052]|uniref:hypothetical protein n=1 Tax=Streptomyces sp. NPDC052052 TaxID=3154756 RepID=UPI0034147241